MKKFLLSLATAFSFVLFLGSCTNEEDINNNGYSDKEKAKIETLMNLFDSYGWELDTTVSIEQRNKELLEMDYEKTKSFLEYMSNGIEFDNFEPTQQNEDNAPKALSNTRSTMTFPIYGIFILFPCRSKSANTLFRRFSALSRLPMSISTFLAVASSMRLV